MPDEPRVDRVPSPLAIPALLLGALSLLSGAIPAAVIAAVAGVALALAHLMTRPARRAAAFVALALCIAGFGLAIRVGRLHERALVWLKSQQKGGAAFDLWVGREAPEFDVPSADGPRPLSSYRGTGVVLVFHAPWLDTSAAHVAAASSLVAAVPGSLSLCIVPIEPGAPRAAWPSPFDQVIALPTTFFIGADGIIRASTTGAMRADDLRPYMNLLLENPH